MLLPKENQKDLEEIPANVRRELEIVLVEHMDDVLRLALAKPEEPEVDVPEEIEGAVLLPEETGVEDRLDRAERG